jgi:hypothetical protein
MPSGAGTAHAANGVWRVLARHGLGTRAKRSTASGWQLQPA